ncbi:MAG: orotidine-5'-phosphate decarboxylase [Chloroflexi bacterium]|nr:orotidine-5'-phosphate decarboxylase [Chloroflexota bacterium]
MSKFLERLNYISRKNQSLVCIGLDPDPSLMAVPDVFEFNKAIIDATHDLVCAFKPNLPFYEALGIDGLKALHRIIDHIRSVAPDVIVLGDGKRGDIDSTNGMYAKALFEVWDFDAATVNAYGGMDTLEPFLEYEDKASFLWCKSSNPGAAEFQDIRLSDQPGQPPLYQWMAEKARQANKRGNVGIVVGATFPDELAAVRQRTEGMPILIPGIGAQSGNLERSVIAGLDADNPNVLISSSRGITYASHNPADYPDAARQAANNLREKVNETLTKAGRGW